MAAPGRDCSLLIKIIPDEVVTFAKEKGIGLVVIGPGSTHVVLQTPFARPVLHALVPTRVRRRWRLRGVC